MALGRQRSSVGPVPAVTLSASPRGPFYDGLARAFEAESADPFLERLVAHCYTASRGRPSIPPGVYFRMRFVALLEGIASQRELAWRCSDSLTLRRFLGYSPHESTPDHSTLTVVRRRVSPELHASALRFLAAAAQKHHVLRGRRLEEPPPTVL